MRYHDGYHRDMDKRAIERATGDVLAALSQSVSVPSFEQAMKGALWALDVFMSSPAVVYLSRAHLRRAGRAVARSMCNQPPQGAHARGSAHRKRNKHGRKGVAA